MPDHEADGYSHKPLLPWQLQRENNADKSGRCRSVTATA